MAKPEMHMPIRSREAFHIGNAIVNDREQEAIVRRPGEACMYDGAHIISELQKMLKDDGVMLDNAEDIMAWLIIQAIDRNYYSFEALEGARYLLEPVMGIFISREEMDDLFKHMPARVPQLRVNVGSMVGV